MIFHERDAIVCTILPTGHLEVRLADEEARAWFSEMRSTRTSEDLLWEGTEQYWTNGSFEPFDAGQGNPFVGLSSAPCIAESMDVHDDGTNEINGRFWAYLDYQLRDFGDDLLEHGFAIFTLVE
ncbi:hypothetical protein H4CHR_02917 [Variovorax sp. PBS-H4]|uniref:hypothetical protein n=1 Tax=Variovorax sp. PBS-H4 TaxID=434008 RepID=UPI00131841E7|nr:hypothetical protein [Variovorax sp. PBS-H4]VTU31979.1 hypothetical protein H4CHR_02917 [Variovorax sp. PBS-H4]